MGSKALLLRYLDRFAIIIVVLLMIAVLTYLEPQYFLTFRNFSNILKQIAENAMLSLGMLLVILTAGIDLSVGSVLALAMMCLVMADIVGGWPWWIVVFIGPLVGIAAGLFNGFGLTLLRLPHPFIMTLGTLFAGMVRNADGSKPVDDLAAA